jgi:hypothetical protein
VCYQVLWKAYIDFESELEEYERVRTLYDRLLEKTSHVKVRAIGSADLKWVHPTWLLGLDLVRTV